MDLSSYLKEYQHVVYDTFIHSLEEDKVAQTYLIKGINGAPVLDVAKFLAKTLLCEERDPFACCRCMSCLRFDEGNYADFMLIDGEKSSIKVSDIEALSKFISSSPIEKKGKKIYIINCLENANKESVNALLKTLEEPSKNVYAFITSKNEAKLLPTILSRCQILSLLPIEREIVENEAREKGVDELDAELLSSLYANIDTILSYKDDDMYLKCRNSLCETIDALKISLKEAMYFASGKLIKDISSKEEARLYIDLLSILFKDMIFFPLGKEIVLKEKKADIACISKKIKNKEKCYLEMMTCRGKIETNATISLLLEHIFIYILRNGDENYGRK